MNMFLLLIAFVLTYFAGFLTAYLYVRSYLIFDEVIAIRTEFKKIHDRLISVIAEWQKKPSSS